MNLWHELVISGWSNKTTSSINFPFLIDYNSRHLTWGRSLMSWEWRLGPAPILNVEGMGVDLPHLRPGLPPLQVSWMLDVSPHPGILIQFFNIHLLIKFYFPALLVIKKKWYRKFLNSYNFIAWLLLSSSPLIFLVENMSSYVQYIQDKRVLLVCGIKLISWNFI